MLSLSQVSAGALSGAVSEFLFSTTLIAIFGIVTLPLVAR